MRGNKWHKIKKNSRNASWIAQKKTVEATTKASSGSTETRQHIILTNSVVLKASRKTHKELQLLN